MSHNCFFKISAAFILFSVDLVSAQVNGVTFLFPTEGLTFYYQDTINVTYESNFSKPLLYTFCKKPNKTTLLTEQVKSVAPFNSSQLVELEWPEVTTCYWNLRPNRSVGFGANSETVTIIPTARGARVATFGVDSPSATSTGTNTFSEATSSGGGISSGRKIGIGVGVGVGVSILFIAAIVGFIFIRRKRARAVSTSQTPATTYREPDIGAQKPPQSGGSGGGDYMHMQPVHSDGTPQKPHELASNVQIAPTHEMPANEARYEMEGEGARPLR